MSNFIPSSDAIWGVTACLNGHSKVAEFASSGTAFGARTTIEVLRFENMPTFQARIPAAGTQLLSRLEQEGFAAEMQTFRDAPGVAAFSWRAARSSGWPV